MKSINRLKKLTAVCSVITLPVGFVTAAHAQWYQSSPPSYTCTHSYGAGITRCTPDFQWNYNDPANYQSDRASRYDAFDRRLLILQQRMLLQERWRGDR